MKCAKCGQWNQASLPRCFRCGADLPRQQNDEIAAKPSWQESLRMAEPQETYIDFDPEAEAVRLLPSDEIRRELLGKEVDMLKERRQRGQLQLAHLRQHARQAKESIANAAIIRPLTEEEEMQSLLRPEPVHDLDADARVPGTVRDHPLDTTSHRKRSRRMRGTEHPDEWRHQTDAAWRAQEEFHFVDDDSAPVLYDGYTPSPSDRVMGARGMDPDPMIAEREKASWTASRYPAVSTTFERGHHQTQAPRVVPPRKPQSQRKHHVMLAQWIALTLGGVAVLAAVALGVNQLMHMLTPVQSEDDVTTPATIMASTIDGTIPAHTIFISAKENSQIYIRELQKSYVVTGGSAEIQIPDYFWFDNLDGVLEERMSVELRPVIKLPSGEQSEMPPVRYDIDIPMSNVLLVRPDSLIADVNTSTFDLQLQVDKGSRVVIAGQDVTDLINANGRVTKAISVQAIGENRVQISVRSKHSRQCNIEVILRRKPQLIPLEMSPDTLSETEGMISEEDKLAYPEEVAKNPDKFKRAEMKLTASTVPGAEVVVQTPHRDLDTSKLDVDGTFSFIAQLTRVGDNEVRIVATKDGISEPLMHNVYYVPPVGIYTSKARGITDGTNYSELVTLNDKRIGTVYVCKGTIKEISSERPQLAIMNVALPGEPEILVRLENSSKTTWKLNTYYRIYGDAFGLYDNMPSLRVRYTYTN